MGHSMFFYGFCRGPGKRLREDKKHSRGRDLPKEWQQQSRRKGGPDKEVDNTSYERRDDRRTGVLRY